MKKNNSHNFTATYNTTHTHTHYPGQLSCSGYVGPTYVLSDRFLMKPKMPACVQNRILFYPHGSHRIAAR